MNQILEKVGLKYEDLNAAERETLQTWMETLNQSSITIGHIKTYVSSMRESVEQDLTNIKDAPNNWFQLIAYIFPLVGIIKKWYQDQHQVALKARLRNYMLLESMLSTPEKAKQALDNAIAGLAAKIDTK